MTKVYVVCTRDEPLKVLETESSAIEYARAESSEWTQPIRVFEVEIGLNRLGPPGRLCATFEQGYKLP